MKELSLSRWSICFGSCSVRGSRYAETLKDVNYTNRRHFRGWVKGYPWFIEPLSLCVQNLTFYSMRNKCFNLMFPDSLWAVSFYTLMTLLMFRNVICQQLLSCGTFFLKACIGIFWLICIRQKDGWDLISSHICFFFFSYTYQLSLLWSALICPGVNKIKI